MDEINLNGFLIYKVPLIFHPIITEFIASLKSILEKYLHPPRVVNKSSALGKGFCAIFYSGLSVAL